MLTFFRIDLNKQVACAAVCERGKGLISSYYPLYFSLPSLSFYPPHKTKDWFFKVIDSMKLVIKEEDIWR